MCIKAWNKMELYLRENIKDNHEMWKKSKTWENRVIYSQRCKALELALARLEVLRGMIS